jgi:hypothetical protein
MVSCQSLAVHVWTIGPTVFDYVREEFFNKILNAATETGAKSVLPARVRS